MKHNGEFESRMWRVLEKEKLADLSQYHRPGFFDEVPLYSRFADVSFLSRLNRDQADAFLLSFGIKFLKALIWYEIPRQPFVASLTIWNNPDDSLIVPHVLVCSGQVRKRLAERLALHPVRGAPAKRILRLFSRLRFPDPLQVLEDHSTSMEMSRVFIGYKTAPFPKMIPIQSFERKSRPIRN
jgi:hypothetical protein